MLSKDSVRFSSTPHPISRLISSLAAAKTQVIVRRRDVRTSGSDLRLHFSSQREVVLEIQTVSITGLGDQMFNAQRHHIHL